MDDHQEQFYTVGKLAGLSNLTKKQIKRDIKTWIASGEAEEGTLYKVTPDGFYLVNPLYYAAKRNARVQEWNLAKQEETQNDSSFRMGRPPKEFVFTADKPTYVQEDKRDETILPQNKSLITPTRSIPNEQANPNAVSREKILGLQEQIKLLKESREDLKDRVKDLEDEKIDLKTEYRAREQRIWNMLPPGKTED